MKYFWGVYLLWESLSQNIGCFHSIRSAIYILRVETLFRLYSRLCNFTESDKIRKTFSPFALISNETFVLWYSKFKILFPPKEYFWYFLLGLFVIFSELLRFFKDDYKNPKKCFPENQMTELNIWLI